MYVYAFCMAETPLPALPRGIAHPLQTITAAGVTAIGEPPIDLGTLQQDEARLDSAVVHHDWALCELVQVVTLLPLRFGTQFESHEQLQSHLQAHAAVYQAQLAMLKNRLEFCLKLSAKPVATDAPAAAAAPPAAQLKGRDYFLAKKQRLQQQTLTETQQQAHLDQLRSEITRVYAEHHVEADRVYLLIYRSAAEQLQQQLEQWRQQFPTCDLQCSTPLPPYHFV